MRNEGGQVEVTEQIPFAGAYRLRDLVCLLGIFPQLLYLCHEDLVAAVRVGVAAARTEDLRCIVLQQSPEIF